MLAAIDLDDDFSFVADEIYDEAADRNLAPKSASAQLTLSQVVP